MSTRGLFTLWGRIVLVMFGLFGSACEDEVAPRESLRMTLVDARIPSRDATPPSGYPPRAMTPDGGVTLEPNNEDSGGQIPVDVNPPTGTMGGTSEGLGGTPPPGQGGMAPPMSDPPTAGMTAMNPPIAGMTIIDAPMAGVPLAGLPMAGMAMAGISAGAAVPGGETMNMSLLGGMVGGANGGTAGMPQSGGLTAGMPDGAGDGIAGVPMPGGLMGGGPDGGRPASSGAMAGHTMAGTPTALGGEAVGGLLSPGGMAGGATGGIVQAAGAAMAGEPVLPCDQPRDCVDGFCIDGRCVRCRQDLDCPDGQRCSDRGACVVPPPIRCGFDDDCRQGQRCSDDFVCIDIPRECETDEGCADDGTMHCVDFRCVNARCFATSQCFGDRRCVAGECTDGLPGNGGGTCASPTPLAVGEIARGKPINRSHFGSCSIGEDVSGPESVFEFVAATTGAVCFTSAWYSYPGFSPDIFVRRGSCNSDEEIGCSDGGASQYDGLYPAGIGNDNQAALSVQVTEGQRYFVFVDASTRNSVDVDDAYVLSAIDGPCDEAQLPTACDEAQHMAIGEDFEGNSRFGSYFHESSCDTTRDDGAEQVVHFRSGPQAGPLCVRILDAGETDSIYVRKSRCADGAEVGCSAEGRVDERTVTVDAEPDTDYFVFVDSSLRGSPYRLRVVPGACQ